MYKCVSTHNIHLWMCIYKCVDTYVCAHICSHIHMRDSYEEILKIIWKSTNLLINWEGSKKRYGKSEIDTSFVDVCSFLWFIPPFLCRERNLHSWCTYIMPAFASMVLCSGKWNHFHYNTWKFLLYDCFSSNRGRWELGFPIPLWTLL